MASIKQFNFFKRDILYNNVSLAEVAGISVSVWTLPVDRISDGFLELIFCTLYHTSIEKELVTSLLYWWWYLPRIPHHNGKTFFITESGIWFKGLTSGQHNLEDRGIAVSLYMHCFKLLLSQYNIIGDSFALLLISHNHIIIAVTGA